MPQGSSLIFAAVLTQVYPEWEIASTLESIIWIPRRSLGVSVPGGLESRRPLPKESRLKLIHRPSGDVARTQQLGPYILESLIDADEEGGGTVYRVHIAAHQRTRVSCHRVAEEYYYVLSGRGVALLDGREYPLQPGDFLRLPPGTTHGFVTADEPLELLDIHTPGSRPDRDVYFVDGAAPAGFSEPKQ